MTADMSDDPIGEDLAWEEAVAAWSAEPGGNWVTLGEAERQVGVSKSWYRTGQVPSRLVDGPHGIQRLVPLDAIIERAAESPRIQRRLAGGIGLEAEVALLRRQVEELERRLRRLEPDG